MKSRAGLRPAPSPGRISRSMIPSPLRAATANSAAPMTPPMTSATISRGIASFWLTFPSWGMFARAFRVGTTVAFAVANDSHLLRERVHEENEPELRHRDHQRDDGPED